MSFRGTWAFVDEFGNPNLEVEKEGASQSFIVAAVLVEGAQLGRLRTELEVIRKRFFQTGEMKSSSLAGNLSRWKRLLAALAPLPFKFYGLAVDKRRLERDGGLRWKGSFYKNLCGRAYSKLFEGVPDLRVRADRYGRPEFMQSFARYIDKHHPPTLFERARFEFVDGEQDVAVQLADIVAGVLARVVDSDKTRAGSEQLFSLLRRHALGLDMWPPRYDLPAVPTPEGDGPDARIARLAIAKARAYLAANDEPSEPDVRCRVAVLEVLLLEAQFDERGSLASGYLVDVLRSRSLSAKDENWLRRHVIAPLRDADVIITSSPAGYKLPSSRADLEAFVRHADAVCIPMLNRVSRACDAVKLATHGDVDVLEERFASKLSKLIRALEDARHAVAAEPTVVVRSTSEVR